MMDCKHASKLMSRALDEKLSLRERVSLKFHLFLCKYCLHFSQQLKALRVTISSICKNIEDDINIKLPSETKTRIVKLITSDVE